METASMWAAMRTHILIDAGISNKRIEKGLNEIRVTGNDLDGIHDFT